LEDLDPTKGDQVPGDTDSGSPNRKYWIIGLVLLIVAAIVIPLTITMKAKNSPDAVTLESLDSRLGTVSTSINANIADVASDITAVKADTISIKAKVNGLAEDIEANSDDLAFALGKLNYLINHLNRVESYCANLTKSITWLTGVVISMNTTLATCNCTCGGNSS